MYYCIFVITLLLHHYYVIIIAYYYDIINTYFYIIITSLSRHCHVIITLLLQIAETGNKELLITYYSFSLFSLLHYYCLYYDYYQLLHVTNQATCR